MPWTNIYVCHRQPRVRLSHGTVRSRRDGPNGAVPHCPQSPEVEMNSLKYRTYPFLIAAVSVLAATGGAWRAN
jgi:hypothetical protein